MPFQEKKDFQFYPHLISQREKPAHSSNLFSKQAIAILLSCIVYKHYISGIGVIGVIIVFLALFLRVYYSHRRKIRVRKPETDTFLKEDK